MTPTEKLAAAYRAGQRRRAASFAFPDPWMWEDDADELAAYHAGWNGAPQPSRCAMCSTVHTRPVTTVHDFCSVAAEIPSAA